MKRFEVRGKRSEHGESWGIAMALLDGPRSLEGIKAQFSAIARRFGFFGDFFSAHLHDGMDMEQWLREGIEQLRAAGWVTEGSGVYLLSEEGRREASRALEELQAARRALGAWATAENASRLTLVVHLALAALKLPAAILSGSVGLLSDAIDTLLDGAASLMVYWGLRRNRERLVSRALVLFMLGSGAFALYEAVIRIVRQEPAQPDWFAFVAVSVSAAVCAGLWFVQRFIGLRRESFALVTQSVDSRNHVIVAASVISGLIAAAVRFPWLDYLVGAAVAILILRSAVGLGVELLRSRQDQVDFSRYHFSLFERFRRSQLRAYMLYAVRSGEATSKEQLLSLVRRSLDFRGNALLRAAGLDHAPSSGAVITRCYEELVERGELRPGGQLTVTEAGQRRLSSNRFFVQGETRNELRHWLGLALRVGVSVLTCWGVFAGVYWVGTTFLVPRLPPLPLWRSLDPAPVGIRGLGLSAPGLLQVGAGLALATYAAVRGTLVRSRHRLPRHGRGRLTRRMITDGYFAQVRHPLRGASVIHTAGLFLAFPTGWALAPILLAVIAAVLSTWQEERLELLPRFGKDYEVYAATVRRRLLRPWQAALVGLGAAALVAGIFL